MMKLFGLALSAAVTLGGVVAASAEVPQLNLRWAHFAPPTWGAAKADQIFADEIAKRTDGRVKIRIFWSGSLGGANEIRDLVANGAVDIGSILPSYFPTQYPLLSIINSLPMTWATPDQALLTQEKLLEASDGVKKEMEANDTLVVLSHGIGPNRIQCTSSITKLSDLAGKRIRSFGDYPPVILEKLGAVPVNVSFADQYEALLHKTIDCALGPVENAGILKLSEVAKDWSSLNLGSWAGYSAFVKKSVFESWPAELRDIFREAAKVAREWEIANYVPAENEQLDAAKAAGVTYSEFVDQDRMEAEIPNLLEDWKNQMCGRGQCDLANALIDDLAAISKNGK